MKKNVRILFLSILALSLAMFVACSNEPASSGSGSIKCYLNGIVYDSETLAPISGAKVSNGTQSDTTDKNGCFVLKDVDPGSYTISIVKDNYMMEVVENVVVDSGRFYNRELSDEDKAILAKLISEGAEIDDYYAELLFGGERDRDIAEGKNPDIDSIGDSTTYGQTVFAVGLTPFNAVLEGKIDVLFEDGSSYNVPEGVVMMAICVEQPIYNDDQGIPVYPKVIRTFETKVGKDGSFRFEKILPGFYYLSVDPMNITINGITVEFDGHLFNEEVLTVIGEKHVNTLHVPAEVEEDPFKLKVLSIKAVDKSELPIGDGTRGDEPVYSVSMKAGQAICIEFNKPIDRDADGTRFFFVSNSTQITGYTKHLIVNGDDGHGYAYVWHDSINDCAEDLMLTFSVSSFDKDTLNRVFVEVGYAYQLTITATNLYGHWYENQLKDGVFKADLPIEVVFDNQIPENSTVEGILTKYTSSYDPSKEIPVTFECSGNILRTYAPLEYRDDSDPQGDFWYTLEFKITTDEGIVVYNTKNGLSLPAFRNLILRGENGNCIRFKTAKLEILDGTEGTISPYDTFFIEFNQSLEGNSATAVLNSYLDDQLFGVIPLNCEIKDNVITAYLDEGKALHPGFTYMMDLTVRTERDDVLFELVSDMFEVSSDFDELFKNGLEDFTVVGDKYDWNSTDVSFTWTSLGNFLGEEDVYDLYVRTVNEEIGKWEYVGSIDELSRFTYNYRNKDIAYEAEDVLEEGDLLCFGLAEFILTSYDKDGLMIQSPVKFVCDTVGPEVESMDPYPSIEPGTTYAYLNENPVTFTLTCDELIDSIEQEDVVVGGAHSEYFDVTWEMTGEKSAVFKIQAVNAPKTGNYAEGDLQLTISLRDTSLNETELVLDFKQPPQA